MKTISKVISLLLVISLLCGTFAVVTDIDSSANTNSEDEKCGILILTQNEEGDTVLNEYVNETEGEHLYVGDNIQLTGSGSTVTLTFNGLTSLCGLYFSSLNNNQEWDVDIVLENATVVIGRTSIEDKYRGLVFGNFDESVTNPVKVQSLHFTGNGDSTLSISNFVLCAGSPVMCDLEFTGLSQLLLEEIASDSSNDIHYWYFKSINFTDIKELRIDTNGQLLNETKRGPSDYGLRAINNVCFVDIGTINFKHTGHISSLSTFGIYLDPIKSNKEESNRRILFDGCKEGSITVKGHNSNVYGMTVEALTGCNDIIEITGVKMSVSIAASEPSGHRLFGIVIGLTLRETMENNTGVIKIENSNILLVTPDHSLENCMAAMGIYANYSTKIPDNCKGAIETDENISGDNITCRDNNGVIMKGGFVSGETCSFSSGTQVTISPQSPQPVPEPVPIATKDLTTLAIMICILTVVVVLSLLAVMMARRK